MDDDKAREIAAQWQSPGTIGSTLAALASGCTVDRAELWLDIDQTMHHDNPQHQDRRWLEDLQMWADESDSPLLTGTRA